MVFVAKMRWRIERDYQDLKQDFGLGHYEGRGWRGFHHHATLSIAACAFLMAQRLKTGSSDAGVKKLRPTPGACSSRGLRPSGPSSARSVTRQTRLRRCACA
jgi:SRSO17 transposase